MGIEFPDTQTRIKFGLLESALDNPFDFDDMSPNERVRWLRKLLFDDVLELEPEEAASALSFYHQISQRLASAIQKHQHDETAKFEDWLIRKSDVVIQQIAKAKKGGGRISRGVVRECRIQMILDAYQSMSQCIHVAMLEIGKFLPDKSALKAILNYDTPIAPSKAWERRMRCNRQL